MPKQELDYEGFPVKIWVRNKFEQNRLQSCAREPDTIRWIEGMKEGSILYDVGANIGAYSLIAAMRGIKTFAFEPGFANYHTLCENITLNGNAAMFNLKAFRVALNEHPGKGHLEYSDREPGAAIHILKYGGDEFNVHTLDTVSRELNIQEPDYIKIDVDGGEEGVIAGGLQVLCKCKSALIEVDPASEAPIIEQMDKMGFVEASRRVRNKNHKTTNVIFRKVRGR